MQENRLEKKWFYVDDSYNVCEGVGYHCSPTNPDYWYIPTYASVHKDNLYEHRGDARQAAIKMMENRIVNLQQKIDRLKKE